MADDYNAPSASGNAWAGGISWVAAALLLVASIYGIFQGIWALATDENVVVNVDDEYIYAFSLTTWGWIHLILGIIGAIIAIGIFAGQVWARVFGILIACLSLIGNFLWLPYQPWWAVIIIIIDIIIIWALATWRGDYGA